jgi:4-amino-4-deoxy-L-arabinose transferase-like glycosyltransferase
MILTSSLKSIISKKYLIFGVIGVGVLLRCLYFPNVPPGINQDEASAAYEAYSLLLTGKDRWGNPFPIYFPGWGSGQNVLYSYLTIPAIAVFGLNIFSARLVNVVFGILILPLMYICVKAICNARIAFYSTLLLAILPWHIMMSRWGLESNLLPFFLLLGIYTFHKAIAFKKKNILIAFSLVPWAISFYAYATSIFVVPPLMLLSLVFYRKRIYQHKVLWMFAAILFLTISAPFIIFLLKNQILNTNFGFEKLLPISIPLLPSPRLIESGSPIDQNLRLILNGFDDGLVWNTPSRFLPFFMVTFPFLWIGIALYFSRLKRGSINLFLLWMISCIPLFLLVKLNINRANAFLVPVIIFSIIGFLSIKDNLKSKNVRNILAYTTSIWIFTNSIIFSSYYFSIYPSKVSAEFQVGLEDALKIALDTANPSEKVLISGKIPINYVYFLFFRAVDPESFQKKSLYVFQGDAYLVRKFDRFYFDDQYIYKNLEKPFVYIHRSGDSVMCNVISSKTTKFWTISRCNK